MGRPREFDVDEVLHAALLTFWERGYAQTSVGDLVAATGLSRSSLYGTWGDKEGLFAAALDRYVDLVVTKVLGPLEAEGANLSTIADLLRCLVAEAQRPPGAFGCLLAHSGSERARLDEATWQRVHAHQDRMQSAYANALRGEVADEGAADEAAAMLTVFTRGLTTQIRAGADRAHLEASVHSILSLLRTCPSTKEMS